MLITEGTAFTFRGEPAVMQVIRNDGFAWGRVSFLKKPDQFDVHTRKDWYDYPNEEAIDAFIRAARRPENVTAAVGWL